MPNKSFNRSETASDDDGYHSHTLESAQITNIVLKLIYDCLFCLLFLTVKNPSSYFITLRMPNIKMHEMYNYGMLLKKCGCGVSACLFSLISGSTIKNECFSLLFQMINICLELIVIKQLLDSTELWSNEAFPHNNNTNLWCTCGWTQGYADSSVAIWSTYLWC